VFLAVCIYPQEKIGYNRVVEGVTVNFIKNACAWSVN